MYRAIAIFQAAGALYVFWHSYDLAMVGDFRMAGFVAYVGFVSALTAGFAEYLYRKDEPFL